LTHTKPQMHSPPKKKFGIYTKINTADAIVVTRLAKRLFNALVSQTL